MSYKFFSNKACEYFPCHKGIDVDDFNCLFCFCPLYVLKDQCGGQYKYLENNIKSCENCDLPHNGTKGYDVIRGKIESVISLGKLERE